jgi:predicted O-linked N-acetylglucosamine transferase (SPINDLY family)
LRSNPHYAAAHSNLGSALTPLGQAEKAERSILEALRLDPHLAPARSNLAMTVNYIAERDPADVFAAQRAVEPSLLPKDSAHALHSNVPDPARALRIGYVSADFRSHSVATFFEPVIAHHQASEFEVTCYYNYPRMDVTTRRLRGHAARWRDVFGIPEQALAQLIREDGIDLLVDLGGHTANNRLGTFALKPAPVQVTWLGYPNTTGLGAMDYRITDSVADPPGWTERFHTEQLVRLPGAFLCYAPPAASPDVTAPPVARNGHISFGCFNNLAKMTSVTIAMWGRIMNAVPGARLILKPVSAFADAQTRAEILQRFADHGLDPARIEPLRPESTIAAHLARYGDVDIALDVHPYNGTTTTCEALWMGVPVVTLAGKTHASRVGASLLHALALDELVATSADAYVDIAVRLASDTDRLAQLRAGLRGRMQSSPLMDAERFTRGLEQAYRTMWRTWCAGRSL